MARKMKDSGIEWIGEIPEGWEVVPVRSCFDEVRTKNTDGQEQNALQFKSGNIISKANFNANTDDYVADTITNYTVVLPDTVMINGLNLNYDFKSLRVALVKEKGVITSAYAFPIKSPLKSGEIFQITGNLMAIYIFPVIDSITLGVYDSNFNLYEYPLHFRLVDCPAEQKSKLPNIEKVIEFDTIDCHPDLLK